MLLTSGQTTPLPPPEQLSYRECYVVTIIGVYTHRLRAPSLPSTCAIAAVSSRVPQFLSSITGRSANSLFGPPVDSHPLSMSFMQNQAPRYFSLLIVQCFCSLYWKMVPFL
eukprot:COSAG02_NODE_4147_length_5715_cov_4.516204_9_plen_111_part_00